MDRALRRAIFYTTPTAAFITERISICSFAEGWTSLVDRPLRRAILYTTPTAAFLTERISICSFAEGWIDLRMKRKLIWAGRRSFMIIAGTRFPSWLASWTRRPRPRA